MVAATNAARAERLPPSRRSSPRKSTHRLDSQLDGQVKLLRSLLESSEPMENDDLDQIDEALDKLEPRRQPARVPSAALTREARLVAYGLRYDAGEDLWCPVDAVQLKRRAQNGEGKANLRFGVVEVPVVTEDGKVRVEERAVVHESDGTVRFVESEGGER